jgi:predicted enzyme related to lactoylglutathione lyase
MKKINSVYWVEMVTPNTKEVATFYSEVVGLHLDEVPDDDDNVSYEVRDDNGDDVMGICSRATFPDVPSGWLPHMEVVDLADSASKIEANGGKIISKSSQYCLLEDPSGNRMMLSQTNK